MMYYSGFYDALKLSLWTADGHPVLLVWFDEVTSKNNNHVYLYTYSWRWRDDKVTSEPPSMSHLHARLTMTWRPCQEHFNAQPCVYALHNESIKCTRTGVKRTWVGGCARLTESCVWWNKFSSIYIQMIQYGLEMCSPYYNVGCIHILAKVILKHPIKK